MCWKGRLLVPSLKKKTVEGSRMPWLEKGGQALSPYRTWSMGFQSKAEVGFRSVLMARISKEPCAVFATCCSFAHERCGKVPFGNV